MTEINQTEKQNSKKLVAIVFVRLWASKLINLFVNSAIGMLCALLMLLFIAEIAALTPVCSLLRLEDWIDEHRDNGYVEVLNWCDHLEVASGNLLRQTREIKEKTVFDIPIFNLTVLRVGLGDPLEVDCEALLLKAKLLHEEEARFSACLASFALALIRLVLFID